MTADLRLAIVTDIHHGPPKLTKRGDRALDLLDRFLDFCVTWGPDMVVELGDRINDQDRETDRRLLAEVAEKFRGLNTPRAHLDGNHDSDFLLPQDNVAALGMGGHVSRDLNGYHLVFWNASTKIPRPEPFRATAADLEWLAADLAATNLPAIVFSHVPVSGASMVGNYWFQNKPQHATYPNAADARAIIEASGRVVLCVAGHVHWNSLHQAGGVPHITVQSLTESFTTGGEPAGAWATLEIGGGKIRWQTFGLDPINLDLLLGPLGHRWSAPLPAR